MERPLMNPIFLRDMEVQAPKRSLIKRILAIPSFFGRVLLADIFFWRGDRLQIEDGSILSRLFHVLTYRLLFVPLTLVAAIAALIYLATHPPRVNLAADPQFLGLFHEPASFASTDGTRLDGWVIPVLDAKKVLAKKERVLRERSPAVVLVHDLDGNTLSMLPLVRPLHDAGYVVLIASLRGGNSSPNMGSTFGLREAQDVQAAVAFLQSRGDVDSRRIAAIGVGTGANACALAAERGAGVAAMVLDNPLTDVASVQRQLAPQQPWLAWLQPACKWGFELAYRVDFEELDVTARAVASSRPTLLYSNRGTSVSTRSQGIGQVCDFLKHHVPVDTGKVVIKTASVGGK